MESIARISICSISQLALYKAIVMEAYSSVIMDAFRDQFTAAELPSYKEVLFEEATEEWYAQRDPDEVDREECNCIRLAKQFGHLMEEYRKRFFTYVFLHSPTRSMVAHLDSYLLHMHYTSQLDNLYDNIEVDQLEVDWITWHRDYAHGKTWGDSRTNIPKAMKW